MLSVLPCFAAFALDTFINEYHQPNKMQVDRAYS